MERPEDLVVSVLIPCWNSAGSIERAVESVLEERTFPLECIVVDDGSTDGSLEVIRAVAARDPRVIVLALEPNAGVSTARNRGPRARPRRLADPARRRRPVPARRPATLVSAALAGDAAAIIGQQVWWDGHRRWQRTRYDIDDIRLPGRKSLAANPGLLNYVSPHGKLLRRDCWEGLEFRGRVLGDQPWIIRALLRAGDRIEVLGETVYEWYRPAPDMPSTSITATTRASIARGVEAVGVAIDALREVAAEAAQRLSPADRERLVARYTERLIATDLAAHLLRALDRGDPEIGRLFDAIAGFVAAAPTGSVGQSNALARRILEPVLQDWKAIPANARRAFVGLLRASATADPGLHRHGAGRLARFGLRIATRGGSAWRIRVGRCSSSSPLEGGGCARGATRRGRMSPAHGRTSQVSEWRRPRRPALQPLDRGRPDPVLPFRPMSSGDAAATIRQSPGGPSSLTLLRQGITEILSRRRLIRYLVQADMKKRGSDTVLGNLWWILDPLLQLIVYVIFVSIIARRPAPDYPLFIFAAIVPWKWFSAVITDATTSVVGPERLIRQIAFPKLVLPLSVATAGVVGFLWGLVPMAGLMLLHLDRISIMLVWLPVIAVVQFVFTVAVAVFVSAANVFFRDLGNALGHVLRLWWFLSPGLYSLETWRAPTSSSAIRSSRTSSGSTRSRCCSRPTGP